MGHLNSPRPARQVAGTRSHRCLVPGPGASTASSPDSGAPGAGPFPLSNRLVRRACGMTGPADSICSPLPCSQADIVSRSPTRGRGRSSANLPALCPARAQRQLTKVSLKELKRIGAHQKRGGVRVRCQSLHSDPTFFTPRKSSNAFCGCCMLLGRMSFCISSVGETAVTCV